jgi:hypothetical protein
MAMSTIEARKPTGHLYVAERQDGRVWYAKWRDAEGQHQKKLGPAWVKAHGQTARGAPRWRTADGPKPSPAYMTPQRRDSKRSRSCLAQAPRAARPVQGAQSR